MNEKIDTVLTVLSHQRNNALDIAANLEAELILARKEIQQLKLELESLRNGK